MVSAIGTVFLWYMPGSNRYGSAFSSTFVLPAKEIAKALHRIRSHPCVQQDERGAKEPGKELEDSVVAPSRKSVCSICHKKPQTLRRDLL
jgi:hypothetical protein